MSSESENDRYREHLGVSHTNQVKKKMSRRPINPEGNARPISSAPEHITYETHVLAVRLVQWIPKSIVLISVNQSVLLLLHMDCLQCTTRTYLYRLFVDNDPYWQVLNLLRVLHLLHVLNLPHVRLLSYVT